MQTITQTITLITTGGTIEKTYDEYDGSLSNRESIIREKILSCLRLPYTHIDFLSILAKDSLDLDDEDRDFLCQSVKQKAKLGHPIVVLHGTDTMEQSARLCFEKMGSKIKVPVIFTGAMKPFGFIDSDALQNITEALMASTLVAPGFYISFHGKLFTVPNVRKNREKRTFESI